MSNQVKLSVEPRTEHGKGAAGRLRRAGRVPAIVYGYQVDPTPVSVDTLELYHALRTAAGANVLLRVHLDGEEHLCVARDLQRHPVRGDMLHVDLLAVDKDAPIQVEVPVHLTGEPADDAGVVNVVLHTVPIKVRPLDVPNYLEVSVEGMGIGDVRRVEDIALPAGAEFDIETDRTVVTVNPPDLLEEPEAAEEAELAEGEVATEPEAAGAEAGEDASPAAE